MLSISFSTILSRGKIEACVYRHSKDSRKDDMIHTILIDQTVEHFVSFSIVLRLYRFVFLTTPTNRENGFLTIYARQSSFCSKIKDILLRLMRSVKWYFIRVYWTEMEVTYNVQLNGDICFQFRAYLELINIDFLKFQQLHFQCVKQVFQTKTSYNNFR